MVKGTPAYMAPEIWQGRAEIDYMKADLFALGKVVRDLAPGPQWESLIQSLLSVDPSDRPASASDAWDRSRELAGSAQTSGWKALVSSATSEILSRQLLQAAKQLLFAKRGEEAYWLLAECLQEDPDSAEALRLLESIPALSNGRKRKLWAGSLAAAFAFALALVAAFHFGKSLERQSRFPTVDPGRQPRALLLPTQPKGNRTARVPGKFREFAKSEGSLAGILFLEGSEECDGLSLDARTLAHPVDGIPLAAGEHLLACANGDGSLAYREKIGLLPFQRKIIRLRKKNRKVEA
jgi:hypothetical protein